MSINHQFPPEILEPGYRPGERIVAGEPWVFNQDLLNAYLSDLVIAEAPADFSLLSWNGLTGLFYAYLNRRHRLPHDEATAVFGKFVCDERARRPEYAAFRKACV